MAQQQDPNSDPARTPVGERAIAAGSQDSYRPKGFSSPTTTPPSNTLGNVTTAPGAAQPETYTWGKYSGPKTPGVMAAAAAGGSGQPGIPNQPSLGQKILGFDPLGINPINFKPNNSQLQDIGGALFQGLPITDADWMRAGFGPGGATLATGAQAQPTGVLSGAQNGLRSIVTAPGVGTMPTNAVYRPM